MRERHEILQLTLVYGTLGFRASLEATSHARCAEVCGRLLPWLERIGLASQIKPLHHDILTNAHGSLPEDLRTEAYWRGESASLLGWSIGLLDHPDPVVPVDPNVLVKQLQMLQPKAMELLEFANVPTVEEIKRYCAFCLAVRNRFQMMSLGSDHQGLFDNLYRTTIVELGLSMDSIYSDATLAEATQHVMNANDTRGLYVVRALTAEWLFGEDDEPGLE
ncbi:MAG TPA: hypothetical protein VFA18_21200 [Gemmataceae bacterium]|nr:hypothetical protein [Gemmataceae bacterium]